MSSGWSASAGSCRSGSAQPWAWSRDAGGPGGGQLQDAVPCCAAPCRPAARGTLAHARRGVVRREAGGATPLRIVSVGSLRCSCLRTGMGMGEHGVLVTGSTLASGSCWKWMSWGEPPRLWGSSASVTRAETYLPLLGCFPRKERLRSSQGLRTGWSRLSLVLGCALLPPGLVAPFCWAQAPAGVGDPGVVWAGTAGLGPALAPLILALSLSCPKIAVTGLGLKSVLARPWLVSLPQGSPGTEQEATRSQTRGMSFGTSWLWW